MKMRKLIPALIVSMITTMLLTRCNPIEVIKEMDITSAIIYIESTSIVDQETISREFKAYLPNINTVIGTYDWLAEFKNGDKYSCYCKSFNISRKGDSIRVYFKGSPLKGDRARELIWAFNVHEINYPLAQALYEPIKSSYVNIWIK